MTTPNETHMAKKIEKLTIRPKIPRKVVASVLIECRRRCAICFGIDRGNLRKKGQVAHLDKNRNNNKKENLVWLCLSHHDEYDGRTSQSKGITIDEVRIYRDELRDYMKNRMDLGYSRTPVTRIRQCSPDIYRLRLPAYRAVHMLLGEIIGEATVSRETLNKFLRDTDEVLFLFGLEMDQYIREMHRRAIKLRSIDLQRKNPISDQRNNQLIDNMEEHMSWFIDESDLFKTRFSKFMTLGRGRGQA